MDHPLLHQRRHPDRIARIIGKRQEGAAVRDEAAVQRHAVHHGGHAEFPHAITQVVAGAMVVDPDRGAHVGQVRAGQVGRATEELRQRRADCFQHDLGRLACRQLLVQLARLMDQRIEAPGKACGHGAGLAPQQFGRQVAVLRLVACKQAVPCLFQRRAARAGVPGGGQLIGNVEWLVTPAAAIAHGLDFIGAQRRAVHIMAAGLARGAMADHGLAADQRGRRLLRARSMDGGVDRPGVMAVDVGDHVPAVGGKALRRVVGEPAGDVAVDRDAVVVVNGNQLVQLQGAGQRAHFMADALHQAAVAQEHIGMVVDHLEAGPVELRGQHLLGQRHADRVGQTLAQRSGGGFNAWRETVFRVTGGPGMQLPETPDLRHWQVIAGQVQQRVQQHRRVAIGQHEAVAVDPVRVGRVVPQVAAPQHLGDVGHA